MPTLHRSPYAVLEHHVASGYVRIARSEAELPSVMVARVEIEAWGRALSSIDAKRAGILFDWRRAPLSVDAALIAVLVGGTEDLGKRFARRAMLVSTPVGKLQSVRLNRTQAHPPTTFDNEEEALAFLASR